MGTASAPRSQSLDAWHLPARPLRDARPAPAPPPSAAAAAWARRLGSTSARTSKCVISRRAMAQQRRPAGRTFPARLSPPGPAAASLLPPPSPQQLLSVLGGPARRIPAPPLPGRSLHCCSRRGSETGRGHQASPFPGSGRAPTGRLSPRLPGSLEETQVTTKAVGIFGLFFLAGCGVLAVGFRQ